MLRVLLLAICLHAAFVGPAASTAGPVHSLEDIEFWVGTGGNRAALVIDWNDESSSDYALAWGYRWDGSATGIDLLTAVLAADTRLFAKLGSPFASPASPDRVFGLGYDSNGDGQFALDDGSRFDASGIVISDASEGAATVDNSDDYAEGWQTKFWHYGVADENPLGAGSWTSSQLGIATRTLVDGSWDGWTLADPISFSVFAMNPHAARPPVARGDYNRDGSVTAADYTVWRDTLGQSVDISGAGADGDATGAVDAGDFTIWKQNYALLVSGRVAVSSVPEPTTLLLFATIWVTTVVRWRAVRFF